MDTLNTAERREGEDNSSPAGAGPFPACHTAPSASVTRVAGYVVVSEWRGRDGRFTDVEYDRFIGPHGLNDAADCYDEYERGEYERARPVGIFPCDQRGMPIDKPLDAHTLAKLVKETRAA